MRRMGNALFDVAHKERSSKIAAAHERALRFDSVLAAMEAGDQLLVLRRGFPPSEWGRFLGATFKPSLTVRRAGEYMRIAQHYELIRVAVEAGPLTINQALALIRKRRPRPGQLYLFA